MKTFLIYLFLSLCCSSGTAQVDEPSRFALIGIKEGLTSNQLTDIVQDSFGFIWVATKKGLNRYDGKNVIQFFSDSSSNSLPTDFVSKLKLLPNNTLAAITNSGLLLLNTRTLVSQAIVIPADSLRYAYKVNVVLDVEGDERGNIFIITRSGFYCFDPNRKLSFRYDHYSRADAEIKSFAFGFSLVKADERHLLLCTENGQWIFDIRKLAFITAPTDNPFSKSLTTPGYRLISVYKDEQGFMSIPYKPGISYYHFASKRIIPVDVSEADLKKIDWRSTVNKINDSLYTICGKEKGFYLLHFDKRKISFRYDPNIRFGAYNCKAVLKAQDGRLWVATNKGLFKGKTEYGSAETIAVPTSIYSDSTNIDFRMIEMIGNKMYAGSKEGLFVFDQTKPNPWKRYDFNDINASAKQIHSLLLLNKDSLLVGPNGPLIVFNPATEKYSKVMLPGWDDKNWIPSMARDKEGTLYIPYNEIGYMYIRKKGEAFSGPTFFGNNYFFRRLLVPVDIAAAPDNHLWFVAHTASRFNIGKRNFDMSIDSFPGLKAKRREIQTIVFDKKGKMYFGTADAGLVIYDPSNKTFKQLGRSHGLPDNQVHALYLLNDQLWIGTASGMATFNINSQEMYAYGNIDDEKPETYFTGFRFYYDSIQQKMYAPCNNSILKFDPSTYKKKRSLPIFFIENIRVNDKQTIFHPAEKIELKPGEKYLQVNMSIVNFEDALQEQLFYRFRDKGNWQAVGNQRSLVLSNLSDGVHELEFMLTSKSNSWKPQVIPLSIFIKPPFWKTTWFIVVSTILLLSGLWLLYKARINRIRQKANIDNQLAELEMKSLHAQMNPHFIFNALNSIKEMIWENDKQNASKYLSKFAQLIRTTLEQSRQNFITVKQCVLHLEQYLEMEKIRFEDFKYSIITDKQMEWDQVRMAPMLVQPLVENAIWHGLKNSDAEKKLVIKFYQEAAHIVCEIEDNGPGINHPESVTHPVGKHRSISIENIRSRLQMLNEKYNMSCSLEFIDKADVNPLTKGTIAILRLSV